MLVEDRMIYNNSVTLRANFLVNAHDAMMMDPVYLDKSIREKLAYELAKQILEEDLITIMVSHDSPLGDMEVSAKLTIIQE